MKITAREEGRLSISNLHCVPSTVLSARQTSVLRHSWERGFIIPVVLVLMKALSLREVLTKPVSLSWDRTPVPLTPIICALTVKVDSLVSST